MELAGLGSKTALPFASPVTLGKGLILFVLSFPGCGTGVITGVPLFLEGLNPKVNYLAQNVTIIIIVTKTNEGVPTVGDLLHPLDPSFISPVNTYREIFIIVAALLPVTVLGSSPLAVNEWTKLACRMRVSRSGKFHATGNNRKLSE